MSVTSLFAESPLVIPFRLHGLEGRLAVNYGPSRDPIAAGFGVLGDLGFDLELCRGYPLLVARIEDFGGTGYRSLCGWIQIVTRGDLDGHDPATAREQISSSVDVMPAFERSGCRLPDLAACRNSSMHRAATWVPAPSCVGRRTPSS